MKKTPMRKCTGCGEMKDKKDMIRVIRNADGSFELDMTGRKNGRGAYVCNSIECLKKARKNKGLDRSFKTAVPPEVYDGIEKEFLESEQHIA